METIDEDSLVEILKEKLGDGFLPVKTRTIKDNKIHVVLFRSIHLESVPNLVDDTTELLVLSWKDYFSSVASNAPIPTYKVNDVVETILLDEDESRHHIMKYFPTITKISSLYYESTQSKGEIIITYDDKNGDFIRIAGCSDHKQGIVDGFELSIINAKQIRKLLETTINDQALLVFNDKVFGIGQSHNMRFSFTITGHLEWQLNEYVMTDNVSKRDDVRSKQLLRFKHGAYYLPFMTEMQQWYIKNAVHKSEKSERDKVYRIIDTIIKEENLCKFKHGTLLMILGDAEQEVERLCKMKRGIFIERLSIFDGIDKICPLCMIDGALFIDNDGICHGIGIILDGEAIIPGTPARGARYNAAKTYIARCFYNKPNIINAYAVIISQDGNIDIISTYHDEIKNDIVAS
jgi:hypothetical protein